MLRSVLLVGLLALIDASWLYALYVWNSMRIRTH